jgi:hypothetical protein
MTSLSDQVCQHIDHKGWCGPVPRVPYYSLFRSELDSLILYCLSAVAGFMQLLHVCWDPKSPREPTCMDNVLTQIICKQKQQFLENVNLNGLVCQATIQNNSEQQLFMYLFFHFFIFFTTNQHQNIPTFYITSIIFYYYSNKKIHYNTKLFHFLIQILFILYHIITFY